MSDLPHREDDVLTPGDQYKGCPCLDLILALDPSMHPDPVRMSCPLCDEVWQVFGKITQLELYGDQPQKALDLPSHIALRITSTVSH